MTFAGMGKASSRDHCVLRSPGGDTDEHWAALLADCLREQASAWGWWINYFHGEERNTLNTPQGRAPTIREVPY